MRSSRPTPPRPAASAALEAVRAPLPMPLLMGVVNVTPDSFYPGSRAPLPEAAIALALRQASEGADWIDLGAQSTRPGSEPVSEEEELRRLLPVVGALARRLKVPISVDTDKASVARACREAGATVLNDVSALRADPRMLEEALAFEAVILMHRGGESPKTMQDDPRYADVVREVKAFLDERIAAFVAAGGERGRVLVDPGIGFGKTLEHNLSLLKHLDEFESVAPVVLGASRKSFIGRIMADDGSAGPGPAERLEGSLAVACWASLRGVKVLRVHDAAETRRALKVLAAVAWAR